MIVPGNFSAYLPWRSHAAPSDAISRRADLQESHGATFADGAAHRSPLRSEREAETGADLELYVVAGVGFEPT
jgi:hypothetical protein